MVRLLALLTLLFPLTVGTFAQEADAPEKTAVLEIYLAKDDGTGKAGDPLTEFGISDIPIHCVVQLNTFTPVTVKMNLIAVNVQGVKAETRVVTSSYTTTHNENRVNFTGRPHGRWVPGKYRIDVFVDNSAAGSREFIVERKPAEAKPAAAPSETKPFVKAKVARRST